MLFPSQEYDLLFIIMLNISGGSTCTPTKEVTSQDPPKVLTSVKIATNTAVNNSPSGQSAVWPHTVELRLGDIEDKPKGVRRGVLKVMKQNGKLMTPQERRAVVRHITNKVHLVHTRPYNSDIVARKTVEILPCLKDTDLANTSIGRGYDSLLNQLVYRAESERRGQYRPTKRALNSDDKEDAAKLTEHQENSLWTAKWVARCPR